MQKNNNIIIAPSTEQASSLSQLLELEKSLRPCADWLHCDVMDGVFVNRTLLGQNQLKAFCMQAKMRLDFHLMCDFTQDESKLDEYIKLKPHNITVHVEAFKSKNGLIKALQKIKNAGISAGLVVKIETDINKVFEFLSYIDLLLIMSVKIGKGGQKFSPQAIKKIKLARQQIDALNKNIILQVDGGVTNLNCKKLIGLGVNSLVSGSFVYKSEDRCKAVQSLRGKKT